MWNQNSVLYQMSVSLFIRHNGYISSPDSWGDGKTTLSFHKTRFFSLFRVVFDSLFKPHDYFGNFDECKDGGYISTFARP